MYEARDGLKGYLHLHTILKTNHDMKMDIWKPGWGGSVNEKNEQLFCEAAHTFFLCIIANKRPMRGLQKKTEQKIFF